jgi:anti-anti-sigma regulatory factor
MPIILKTCEESSVISLEGAIDISFAAELKALLIEALRAGKEVGVSLAETAELDVTALELLWAAEREAQGAGLKFALTGPVPPAVVAAVTEAGFEKFLVPLNLK